MSNTCFVPETVREGDACVRIFELLSLGVREVVEQVGPPTFVHVNPFQQRAIVSAAGTQFLLGLRNVPEDDPEYRPPHEQGVLMEPYVILYSEEPEPREPRWE